MLDPLLLFLKKTHLFLSCRQFPGELGVVVRRRGRNAHCQGDGVCLSGNGRRWVGGGGIKWSSLPEEENMCTCEPHKQKPLARLCAYKYACTQAYNCLRYAHTRYVVQHGPRPGVMAVFNYRSAVRRSSSYSSRQHFTYHSSFLVTTDKCQYSLAIGFLTLEPYNMRHKLVSIT